MESQRRPVGAAQVDVTEDDVIGIGGIGLVRSFINVQIWVNFTGCLVYTAAANSINVQKVICFIAELFISFMDTIFSKSVVVSTVLTFRQICIATIQHNEVSAAVMVNRPLRIVVNGLINGTVNGISAADFPQLLLIADQDIGFAVKLLNNLPRKITSVCLAFRNGNRVGLR